MISHELTSTLLMSRIPKGVRMSGMWPMMPTRCLAKAAPWAVRARIEAGEALQEEVDELSVEVRALRQKLDAKSLVECRIPHPSRTYFGLGLLSRVGLGLGLVFIII